MRLFQGQWQKVAQITSEVDLTFLLLRIFSLAGGIVWIIVVPLPPAEMTILVKALFSFAVYSFLCYLVIFFRPWMLKNVYLATLFLDLVFLTHLVYTALPFADSFFLGYYLLICLHTIYFGLRFGLCVAFLSALCYTASILPTLEKLEWTDLAIRVTFFFLITVPVGLLTAKVKREKEKVEMFNNTLEAMVAQRTEKIGTLLERERYLRETLDTVADINKLLITSPDMKSLLENSCVRFVEHSHYGFCWIGLLENGTIESIYPAKIAEDSLVELPYDVHDEESIVYTSSAAQCVRENATIIRKNNRLTTFDQTMWQNADELASFHYLISLPLRAKHLAEPLGVLTIYSWRPEGFEIEEKEMLDELAGDIGFAIDSFRQRESVLKLTAERTANYEETIFSFVDMIEQRDTYTAGHTDRVAKYCEMIAREMGFDLEQRKNIYKAAILHDIGKIATPDSVLLTPGKLTSLDYDLIKLHASAGYEMLSEIDMYKDLAEIVLYHHERHDGTGYPEGLKGDEIPPLSRIMAVGDAFDAMTTNRIYKARKEIPEAIAELQRCSGTQFHPEVVNVAVKVLSDIEATPASTQLPITKLEKKRFSYFFNDMLTGLYNEDYLKIILNNLDTTFHKCLYMLQLNNVPEFNKKHGWDKGNTLIKQFAASLSLLFPDGIVFRVYGNDFAIIFKEHMKLDAKTFKDIKCIADTEIEVEVQHLDLSTDKAYTIDKLDKLEVQSLSFNRANRL